MENKENSGIVDENDNNVTKDNTSAVNKPIETITIPSVEVPSVEIEDKKYPKPLKISYDDIFVTEKNTFDVDVVYYKDGNGILVKNVDEAFSNIEENQLYKITVTFKYPSQGDVTSIANNPLRGKNNGIETIDMTTFSLLELSRLVCLIRKWSIDKPIDNESLMGLNPKIVKAILYGIREKLGNTGIF